MPKRMRGGVLGATGAVGQRFVQLLAEHPWFELTAVAASDRSVGLPYGEACTWRLEGDVPAAAAALTVQPCAPPLDCDLVFSALPADIALGTEPAFADAGYAVFSNASSHRLAADVPLLVPEVNPEHLALLDAQRANRGWGRGCLVTNPNCSTIGLVLALKPLHQAFGVRQVLVATMQALSGAGYPGVPGLDSLDNVVPYIGGEEDKLIHEPRKLLGRLAPEGDRVLEADVAISPSCHRVATRDGHLEAVSVSLARPASAEEVLEAWQGFESAPYALGCPSAVQPTIIVRHEPDRPQPVRDRDAGRGMAVSVGRLRPCQVLHWKFLLLSHNTIRGAAGGAILNAELALAQGRL